MKAYIVFDDFDSEAVEIIQNAGVDVTIHPKGVSRPDSDELTDILKNYDIVVISTAQKISEDMLADCNSQKIIATASIGIDHIMVGDKSNYIKVVNAPTSGIISVAEYVLGVILTHKKRIIEGHGLFQNHKDKKSLKNKPTDIFGKTLGVIGAGGISEKIIELAKAFSMNMLVYTFHPENHEKIEKMGAKFVSLDELMRASDIISLNMPLNDLTRNMISEKEIKMMKNNALFVSISRLELVDINALINKAQQHECFSVSLDVDLFEDSRLKDCNNIIITPHIAGGTVESRKRMFMEISQNIVRCIGG